MGGADENNIILESGEKYDPDSNTWSPIPTMLQVPSPLSYYIYLYIKIVYVYKLQYFLSVQFLSLVFS